MKKILIGGAAGMVLATISYVLIQNDIPPNKVPSAAASTEAASQSPVPHQGVFKEEPIPAQANYSESKGSIEEDIKAARNASSLRSRLEHLTSIFTKYAERDPRGAVELAQNALSEGELNVILPQLLAAWAKLEPDLAVKWFLEHEADPTFAGSRNSNGQQLLLQAAFEELASKSPSSALSLAQLIKGDGVRQSVLLPIANAAVLDGKTEALLQDTKKLEASSRLFMASAIFSQWAEFDLKAASQAFARDLSQEEQGALASSIGLPWMQVEPASASSWWLNTASNKEEAVIQIASTWQTLDENSAVKWLQGLPEASQRDSARNSIANHKFGVDPDGALAIANAIEDPEKRTQVWGFLVRLLQGQKPDQAAAIIKSAPQELRDSLNSAPKN